MAVERSFYIYATLLLVFSFFPFFTAFAEGGNDNKNDSLSAEQLIELRNLYSFNKVIPSELEKEILISLSHYPELKNARIKFCYSRIFTSMKAVPTMGFLFKKKENRNYRIVMNSKTCMGLNVMQRTSIQALTGVLGHELGHIKDYSELSNFKLMKLLVGYISKKGRIATEIRADKIAVEHNLGKELLEFTKFIYQDECMNPKYIRYKKKYYNSISSLGSIVSQNQNPDAL